MSCQVNKPSNQLPVWVCCNPCFGVAQVDEVSEPRALQRTREELQELRVALLRGAQRHGIGHNEHLIKFHLQVGTALPRQRASGTGVARGSAQQGRGGVLWCWFRTVCILVLRCYLLWCGLAAVT